MRILVFLTLVMIAGGVQAQREARAPGVYGQVVHVYHGLPVNADLKPVKVDAERLMAAVVALEAMAGQVRAKDYQRNREMLLAIPKAAKLGGAEARYMTDLLRLVAVEPVARALKVPQWRLDYLLEAQKVALLDRHQLKAIPRINRDYLREFRFPREIFERVVICCLDISWMVDTAYTRDCRKEGVPIPPDWGNAAWVKRPGSQPQNRLFLQAGDPVEVWTYTPPAGGSAGGCIALPRWDSPAKTGVTLGVICQSATTSKACIWDNRLRGGGPTFVPTTPSQRRIASTWTDGYDPALSGGGKCVMCHRGDNVFLLHPNTALGNRDGSVPAATDLPFTTAAAAKYTLVNSLGWSNPANATLAGGGGCKSCHGVGSITVERASYCAILKQAAQREMPNPTSPAGWASPSAGYSAHINAMKAECGP
ncbi:hypothetical protein [Sandaracinobacteroides saxicola]|uniref:Cytochrome c domain-containing protein n=1 Tax=Sandaracinobacteroides saxicola TaxID=2759707 RepID=A0A7G5IE68_9SPHN|nr:hypothetical protein [Sandaracinobacteroides saxicola]QMW21660.1 hypothetical protein H3309_09525 [Sandaracinobacteroides saxicola]